MSLPLVSVIIPTYNQVDFVHEAISSALQQDYPRLQVVVADDGSTDGTVEVIREYARKHPDRLTAITGEPHLGITGNCNRALQACRGKYIAFGAGDDAFLPGKITMQVEWFETDPRRVLCGHDVEVIDETGNVLYLWSSMFPLRAGRGAEYVVQHGYVYAGISLMVRATALPDYGYDERLPVVSDWKLWIDCLASGGIFGYIDGVHARYRRHGANTFSDSRSDVQKWRAILEDQLATLGLTEAAHPHLLQACRHGRALCFYERAKWYLTRGQTESARAYLIAALAESLGWSWRVALRLILTLAPPAWASIALRLSRHVKGKSGFKEQT